MKRGLPRLLLLLGVLSVAPSPGFAAYYIYCLDRRVAIRVEEPDLVLPAHPRACALSGALALAEAERRVRGELGGAGADCYCTQNNG